MWFLSQLVAVVQATWLCVGDAAAIPSPALRTDPQACVYDTDDASSVLFFAIGAHATDITNHVNECQRLGSSESNTVENHIMHWQDGIQPAVISMRDLINHLARFEHLPPWKREVARRIHPHITNMEEHTNAALSLLAGSGEGRTERSYTELLAAALEDAHHIVQGMEVLWHCGELRAPVP